LFGFCFSDMHFLVFDPNGFGVWSNELTDLIKHNMGSFGDKIEKGICVLIGQQTKEKLKETIAAFIWKHKLTKEAFDSISILSETWLHESVKSGESVDKTAYSLKSLFRILT
jgi:hypothetical protein